MAILYLRLQYGVLKTKMSNESIDLKTRAIITFKIYGDFPHSYEEIVLFETTGDNIKKSYRIEMKDCKCSENVGTRNVSGNDVDKLLDYIKDLNLPRNPKREYWCDTSAVTLCLFDKKYEWFDPVPYDWEPLEVVIKWLQVLSEFEKYRRDLRRKKRINELKIINLRKHYPYTLDKNHTLYIDGQDPAGLIYRKNDALEFVKSDYTWLELEREPENEHDRNAIKVVGCSKKDTKIIKRHIGYIPRGYAAAIAIGKHFHQLKVYLHRTYYDYRTKQVYVEFDVAGPIDRRRDFQESLIKAHIKDKTLDIDRNFIQEKE